MNWLLVILISSSPVKTDMVFSDLNSCMKKETEIRQIYTERVNEYIKWNESMKIYEKEKKENNNARARLVLFSWWSLNRAGNGSRQPDTAAQ